jgi:hypothetical protein
MLACSMVLALVPVFAQQVHERTALQLLDVSAEQVESQYCLNYPNSYSVFFKVRVRYANTSDRPVILRKDSLDISRVQVASSLATAEKKTFVYAPHPLAVSASKPARPVFGPLPDSERFVILDSEKSFSIDQWTELLAASEAKTANPGPLFGQNYVMRLIVWTWPSDEESDAAALAKEWQQWGQLQTETVESAFFPIHMPPLPRRNKSESCDRFPIPGY